MLRECPLCGRNNQSERPSAYSREPWIIRRCADCRFVYLENALPYEEFVTEQAWTENYVKEKAYRESIRPVYSTVSRNLRRARRFYETFRPRRKGLSLIKRYVRAGTVLDVGCGHGHLLRQLDNSFVPFGIELEARTAKLANEYAMSRGGFVVHADAVHGLQQLSAEHKFNAIVMLSYLEHEVEPRTVLQLAKKALSDLGHLIIKVPNFASLNRRVCGKKWCGFRYPDHVNYFTPGSLRAFVRGAGLQVAHFGLADRPPFGDNMWLVARKNGEARSMNHKSGGCS